MPQLHTDGHIVWCGRAHGNGALDNGRRYRESDQFTCSETREELALSQNIDFSKLTPIELMFGEDFEQTQEIAALFEEAELYLSSFHWCDRIKKAYFGLGVSDFVGIFLFEIEPSVDTAERFHWVVAGDVPPACIAGTECRNSAFALHQYIRAMKNWCNAELSKEPTASLLARGAKHATHSAHDLMSRITLLDSVILEQYKDDLT